MPFRSLPSQLAASGMCSLTSAIYYIITEQDAEGIPRSKFISKFYAGDLPHGLAREYTFVATLERRA